VQFTWGYNSVSILACNSHFKRIVMHKTRQFAGLLPANGSFGKVIFHKPQERPIESLNTYIAHYIYSACLTAATLSSSFRRCPRSERFMHMVSVVRLVSTMSNLTYTFPFQECSAAGWLFPASLLALIAIMISWLRDFAGSRVILIDSRYSDHTLFTLPIKQLSSNMMYIHSIPVVKASAKMDFNFAQVIHTYLIVHIIVYEWCRSL
jgi:hypothetical protein